MSKERLEQIDKDIEALLENKKQLQAEMEVEKKPVLRIGDYGVDEDGTRLTIGKTDHRQLDVYSGFNSFGLRHSFNPCWNKLTAYQEDGDACGYLNKDYTRILSRPNVTWLGNIFDDLKTMREDLDMFSITSVPMHRIRGSICDDGSLFLQQQEDYIKVHPDVLSSFVRNIRQMEATVKRRQK